MSLSHAVVCLCLALSAVEASRPAHAKALVSRTTKTRLGASGPETGSPIFGGGGGDEPVVKSPEGTDTGVEPVDEVSKNVPDEVTAPVAIPVEVAETAINNPEDLTKIDWTPHIPHITGTLIMTILISILTSLCMLSAFAFCYTKIKTDPLGPPQDGDIHTVQALNTGTWRYGTFDCFHDTKICLISCCCPIIRWSDTMRMAGLMGFWAAVLIMGFLWTISGWTDGLFGLVMLGLAVYRRQQIRALFGMQRGDAKTFLEDCCCYCWCSCCLVIQEARQLEEAYAVGYPLQIKDTWRREERPMSSTRVVPPQQMAPQPVQYSSQVIQSPPPSQPQVIYAGQPPQYVQAPPRQYVQGPSYLPGPQSPMGSMASVGNQPQMMSMPPQSMQGTPPGSYPPGQYQQPQFRSA